RDRHGGAGPDAGADGARTLGREPLRRDPRGAPPAWRLHGRRARSVPADWGDRNADCGLRAMTDVTTHLWWVRHAPVAPGGRSYGQTDLSCDCSETALFTGLAEQLPRGAVWVTSNLRRTHETAAAIIRAGLPGPRPIPGAGAS